MPYPQDLEGKFIDYHVHQGVAEPASPPLKHGVLRGVTKRANVAVYDGMLTPGSDPFIKALHIKNKLAPWSFKFLRYYAGIVTVTSLNTPVMSGPMTGCFLCRYTRKGTHIAHIGTAHTPTDSKTISAKSSWLGFVARDDVTAVTGGSPFDCFNTAETQSAMSTAGGMLPSIVGYFDGTAAYAILLAPLSTRMTTKMPQLSLSYVAKVKPMVMRPWGAIAATPKFR